MDSSLIMYPIPKPSAHVGPNPKWRRHGLPQFEVDRTVVLILSQPGSLKMAGVGGVGVRAPRMLPLAGDEEKQSSDVSESIPSLGLE
jgi:hypothetical protein